MDLQSIIKNATTGNIAGKIGQATGTDQSTVEKVIQAGLPVILGQLGNNTKSPDGATSLDTAVEKDHTGGSLLDSLSGLFDCGDTNVDGTKILDHIFGSSTSVVSAAVGKKTGVNVATVVKILTFLAPLVMASLGKKKTSENLDAGGLSDVLTQETDTEGNPLTDIASSILSNPQVAGTVSDVIGGLFKKN